MVQLITVKSSTVRSKLYRFERTFKCWNGLLAHNLRNNLNCNKYKLGERTVTCKLVPRRFVSVSRYFLSRYFCQLGFLSFVSEFFKRVNVLR